MQALYPIDRDAPVRTSHQNPAIQRLYAEFLEKPLSHKSHELLHTHYEDPRAGDVAMEPPIATAGHRPLVSTIGERCRVCYQCVRECPAKAIRIADRQAQVLPERCIGCGVCFKVCTQDAKRVLSAVEAVEALLAGPAPVAAIVAPSFPAEFIRYDYTQVVGTLRALGFASVHEVAFGAELVAHQYRRLVAQDTDKLWIATTCPAVVGYVRRYHPDLTGSLAPIVSPMIATARLLRALHGDAIRVVFIGPCIAKKREAISPDLGGEVDEALTFAELRRMLTARSLDLDAVAPGDFDPPHARGGGLFPISGGMLQVAGIQEDLVTGHVMVGEGPAEFAQAIKEAETGIMETRLLEVLFCHGCTMGPGMSSDLPHFGRRARVSQFVRHRIASVDAGAWRDEHERWSGLDLARSYSPFDLRLPVPSPEELVRLLGELGKSDPRHELNCGACGYSTCRELASAIYDGLAEPRCACRTASSSSAARSASWPSRTRSSPARRRRWSSPRSWRAWASWPPASPTR